MKHLTNFTIYSHDTDQFGNLKTELPQKLSELSLDGAELLISYQLPDDIPLKSVVGVHLPFWVTWLEIWRKGQQGVDQYYSEVEASHLKYISGGANASEMVENLATLWKAAAKTRASYAVIHACHVELTHAFTRQFTYSSEEVLTAFADMLNSTAAKFPNGEPPMCIAIENLWWPGLTLTDHDATQRFIDQLTFENWCFVLDTGHMLNTNHDLDDEHESIQFLLKELTDTPKTILKKIEVLHLSYSCSGKYQKETIANGTPVGFEKFSFQEKYIAARDHAMMIDKHEPFSLPTIKKLVELINPTYLVHEFLGSIEKKEKSIRQQRSIF